MSRPRPKIDTLQPLAPILAQTLQQAGLGRVVLLGRIRQHWEAIVGPQLAQVTHPESVRARVLFVTATEAIWLQQLTFYQSQLLRNLRTVLGDVPIAKLHVALAVTPQSSEPTGTTEDRQALPLTAAEEQYVLEETSHVADPVLRDSIRQAWRKGWQAGR